MAASLTREGRLLGRIRDALTLTTEGVNAELAHSGEGVLELHVEFEGEWFTVAVY